MNPTGISFYNSAAYLVDDGLKAVVKIELSWSNKSFFSKNLTMYPVQFNTGGSVIASQRVPPEGRVSQLWVGDYDDNKIYAYDLETKKRTP